MTSPKTIGRRLGILFLAHLISGLTTPYILLQQLSRPKTFAAVTSVNPFQVRLAVMLLFVGGALTIAIAVAAWPIFRYQARASAMWLVMLATANFALQCVEIGGYMTMFGFSYEYASAAGNVAVYDVVGTVIHSAWRWVHYPHLLVMVSWMLLLFVTLWRAAAVPKVLAGLAILAALMQITGISLPQFIPYPTPPMMAMGMPLGFAYLALAIWLMMKGFPRKSAVSGEQSGAVAGP